MGKFRPNGPRAGAIWDTLVTDTWQTSAEIGELLGIKASVVSPHLSKLRGEGWIFYDQATCHERGKVRYKRVKGNVPLGIPQPPLVKPHKKASSKTPAPVGPLHKTQIGALNKDNWNSGPAPDLAPPPAAAAPAAPPASTLGGLAGAAVPDKPPIYEEPISDEEKQRLYNYARNVDPDKPDNSQIGLASAHRGTGQETVDAPPHYLAGGIECIDYIRAKLSPEQFYGYCLGCTIKYMSRADYKGKRDEDLAKAEVYLGWAKEAAE